MDVRLALAVGDAAVVSAVVVAGLVSHGTNPLAAPVSAFLTLAPFLAGWLVAAGLLRVYRREREPWGELRVVAGAWLAGANLGLLLRGSPWLTGGTAWPFPLVITGTTLGVLLLWRVVVAAGLRTPAPARSAGD